MYLLKRPDGFTAFDDEAAEAMQRIKNYSIVECNIKCPRNNKFLRKFMAMINIAFDAFEPAVDEYKGIPVQKNIDRFRKDIIIAAGYHNVVPTINGGVKLEAHSISFARMNEETFSKLYNACCNAVLQLVLRNYTRNDLDRVVDEILRF